MHFRGLADAFHLPVPDESVDTVITDPPWHYAQRYARVELQTQYTMIEDGRMGETMEEIHRVLKPRGHFYVFVPERKLSLALFEVIKPTVSSQPWLTWKPGNLWTWFATIVWIKTQKDGVTPRMGLGTSYRHTWESILCLSKGRPRPLEQHNVRNTILAHSEGKSRKPPEIYRTLVQASTPSGGVILDPFCGSDPLGRAGLDDYQTLSFDIVEGGS